MAFKTLMKLAAKELPIYDRAIAHYPHLSHVKTARSFCFALCNLAAVPTISQIEYWDVARVANGGEWNRNDS